MIPIESDGRQREQSFHVFWLPHIAPPLIADVRGPNLNTLHDFDQQMMSSFSRGLNMTRADDILALLGAFQTLEVLVIGGS